MHGAGALTRKLTQVRIAKTLGISQDSVSRLEKRSDLLLSTLRKTVKAMGGNLSIGIFAAMRTGFYSRSRRIRYVRTPRSV